MWDIFKFELKYRAKRPATYIYFAIMFLFAFLAITTDIVQVGGSAGQIKQNAPSTIAFFYTILSAIVGMFLASAIMGVPIIRDFEHNTASMIFTTPITKFQYLGGRYLGSFVTLLFVFSGMYFGMVLGLLMPWIDQEKLLPYDLWNLTQPFLLFASINAFILSGLLFASGALSRKIMVVYVQGILLFILYNLGVQMVSDLENQDLGAILDPFGIITTNHFTRYWTVAEKNSQLVSLTGVMLWNRLLWMGVSLLALVFTFWKFNFNIVGNATKKQKKKAKAQTVTLPTQQLATAIPAVTQNFGIRTHLQQLWSLGILF
ncbi:MAG: hypothetical protein AAF573_18740 [Bacteroidota bacterium]